MPALMPPRTAFRVTVVFSPEPRTVREWVLMVEPGTVVSQALAMVDGLNVDLSPSPSPSPSLAQAVAPYRVGIWNKVVELTQTLCEHDRIELYRALKVDPKVARRERFVQQGRRSAGLFTKKNSP